MRVWFWFRKNIVRSGQGLAWAVFKFFYLPGQRAGLERQEEAITAEQRREFSISQELASRGGNLTFLTSEREGSVEAGYSFRFIAVPLDHFYKAMQDMVTEPTLDQFAKKLYEKASYRKKVFEGFLKKAADPEVELKEAEDLREEMFHHRHLRNTSLWSFSQGFSLLYRFASSYICFHRSRTQDWHKLLDDTGFREVSRFMFNICLTSAYLKSASRPVIEGYAHREEDKKRIGKVYGEKVATIAGEFVQLQETFEKRFGSNGKFLLAQLAKDVLNIPIAQGELLEDFSFFNVRRKFLKSPLRFAPSARFREVKRMLEKGDLPAQPDECRRRWLRIIDIANFESQFSPGLIWYFTRGWVPDQLAWFLLTKLLLSKYGIQILLRRLILDLITRGGRRMERYAYSGLPALRTHTLEGEPIIYDPAIEFIGEQPEAGAPGFEAGIRGFTDRMFNLVRLQSLLTSIIIAKFLRFRGYQAYREFIFHWIPILNEHRTKIEPFLHHLDGRCEELVAPLRAALNAALEKALQRQGKVELLAKHDPLTGELFDKFLASFEALFWKCWDLLSKDTLRKELVLKLGDGLYMHGLS